jgi:hypothetical protein
VSLSATRQHDDAFFAYRTARLCGVLDRPDESLEWLRKAIGHGFDRIGFARIDPDLTKLRAGRPLQFANLVKVTSTFGVEFGLLNDDVVFTNTSGFTLHNVVLDVRLEQGSQVWTRRLQADVVRPGQRYKWEDVVSIPGSRLTGKSATFSCDENR